MQWLRRAKESVILILIPYPVSQANSDSAEFYVTLKKTVPLTKLPDEIKVMILKLVFEPKQVIHITSFTQIKDLARHPLMDKNSGISGLAAQVVFGSSTIKIDHPHLAKKVFTKSMPKVISRWIKGVDINWVKGSSRIADQLLLCNRMESLTLNLSFLKLFSEDEKSDADKLVGDFFMRKLVEKLPTTCQVVIIDSAANKPWHQDNPTMKQNQDASRAAMQASFDNRTGIPPKKTRPKKKTDTGSTSSEANADTSALAEVEAGADADANAEEEAEAEATVPQYHPRDKRKFTRQVPLRRS